MAELIATKYPNRRFGFVVAEADQVLRGLFGNQPNGDRGSAIGPVAYADAVYTFSDVVAPRASSAVFTNTSNGHVYIDKQDGRLSLTESGAVVLADWSAEFVEGDAAWTSAVERDSLTPFLPSPIVGGIVKMDAQADEAYGYPTAAEYRRQMDIRDVRIARNGQTLEMSLGMTEVSNPGGAPLGFGQVTFNVYFDFPETTGQTSLPKLSAVAPGDFTYDFLHVVSGDVSTVYSAAGADADTFGETVAQAAPTVGGDTEGAFVKLSYDATALGRSDWSGVRIYVTTWDVDANGNYLSLASGGGPEAFTGAAAAPKIMDDAGPFEVPTLLTAIDPANDEAYFYPTEEDFDRQQDILSAEIQTDFTQLSLRLSMGEVTTVWNPVFGFDHASVTVFVSIPNGPEGVTFLPEHNADMPNGLAWYRAARAFGYPEGVASFTSTAAAAGDFGPHSRSKQARWFPAIRPTPP